MFEHTSLHHILGQTNGSALTLVAESLYQYPNHRQTFPIAGENDEKILIDYLLRKAVPDLIIRIIDYDHGQDRGPSRASIDDALRQTMQTIMEQTNVWVWNGTRALVDLTEESDHRSDNHTEDSRSLTWEPFGKSQLLIYQRNVHRQLNKILSYIEQQPQFKQVPLVALLVQGDSSSAVKIVENMTQHRPTIILKGTGSMANQLAAVYEAPSPKPIKTNARLSKPEVLPEVHRRRLTNANDLERSLVLICQPGRDELNESILQAIGAVKRLIDPPRALLEEFLFAMRWNKLVYAQLYLLNHDTIIEWTNEELDQCLEMAILYNAVSFVEALFDYGASLQRLAVVSNSDVFVKDPEEQKGQMVELMIGSLPMVTRIDSVHRIRAYVQVLFQWATEHQYFDLLMIICTRLEDSIIGILLVHQWCQFKEKSNYTTANIYRKHRQQLDIYAADILDLCYEENEVSTLQWLNEKSTIYHDHQATVLIDDVCPKQLLSTKCIQTYMNSRWYGDQFHCDKNFTWEILICLVCICPVLLFIPAIRDRVLQWEELSEVEHSRKGLWYRVSDRFEPFRRFYQKNAVIRFHYSLASYTAFLVLFSYTILFDYFPLNIYKEHRSNIYRLPLPISEIIVHIFLASIAIEEVHQIYLHVKSILVKSSYWKELSESKRDSNTIWSFYSNDPWNVLDFIAFTLWIVGFSTRFVVRDTVFAASKICMSLDLCLWYMRCLHVFLASERLGAKLLMIFHTMKDLLLFLFFILIFLCAYTITTYSLISTSSFVIWSNATHFTTIQNGGNLTNLEIFRSIVEWGTWKIFGSTSLTTTDLLEVQYSARNDAYGLVTLILTITFLIIAYVLLLNNLIALFNFTIQRVHVESHRAWCHHFYVVLKEYEEKDFLVPPFNLLLWPISFLLRKKFDRNMKNETFLTKSNQERDRTRRRQQRIAEQYWRNKRNEQKESTLPKLFVCRHCQRRETEADDQESTFL